MKKRSMMSKANEFFSPLGTFGTFSHESTRTVSRKVPPDSKIIVVDIGCGSGIIGTSVADLADEVIFLDVSPAALAVAEKNFRTYFPEKQAQFIVSDLLSALPPSHLLTPNFQLLFLTNLPYIRADDWEHMSADTVHEPRLALFGGETTGFELYERLFEQIIQLPTSNFQLPIRIRLWTNEQSQKIT
jgi:methylase of polypeptide subunit release factors